MKYKALWLFFICLVFIGGVNLAYASDFGPFRGKIVDADTKEPIEGVVVLAEWWKTYFFHGSTFHDAQETVTNKNGEFEIRGIWMLNPWWHFGVDTILTIFKSGYGAVRANFRDWKDIGSQLPHIWNFKNGRPVIMLKKSINVEERKRNFPSEPVVPIDKYPFLRDKWKLLRQEMNKEQKALGMKPIY